MRIIGGSVKGRKIKFPKGKKIRPLMDQVREALFNILGESVADSYFLDLFAGTGAVGIEALSRGAARAAFVEKDYGVAENIRKNLELLGLKDRAEVYCLDVLRAIKLFHRNGAEFDIIFLGPPYDSSFSGKVLDSINQFNIVKNNGIIIAEYRKGTGAVKDYENFIFLEERLYGETALSFYRRK